MRVALNTAADLNSYVLSDRVGWLTFSKNQDLALLYSGDPVLFNQYAYLPVDPARHPPVKADLAQRLETWLVSARAGALIAGY